MKENLKELKSLGLWATQCYCWVSIVNVIVDISIRFNVPCWQMSGLVIFAWFLLDRIFIGEKEKLQ